MTRNLNLFNFLFHQNYFYQCFRQLAFAMFSALGAIAPIWLGIWRLLKWICEWRAAWNSDYPAPIFYDASSESPELVPELVPESG